MLSPMLVGGRVSQIQTDQNRGGHEGRHATPQVLRGDLNFEQIARSEPDVIIVPWSGIDQDEYKQLSWIVPVVVPEGTGDYAMPWDGRALLIGALSESWTRRDNKLVRFGSACKALQNGPG